MILTFEGPDRSGKSEISSALSIDLGIPRFKNKGEWLDDIKNSSYFVNTLTYGNTMLIDFIEQVQCDVIFDRHYPSEWVYSRFFGRQTNEQVLRKIDDKLAEMGAMIVICRRKSYNGIQDDLYSYIDSDALKKIDALYEDFTKWTKCKVLTLWVDDENLTREITEIKEWIKS
jgi:thymidylate kinase